MSDRAKAAASEICKYMDIGPDGPCGRPHYEPRLANIIARHFADAGSDAGSAERLRQAEHDAEMLTRQAAALATEVHRLREESDQLRGSKWSPESHGKTMAWYEQECAKLTADNARLREALTDLLDTANDLRSYAAQWDWKYGEAWDASVSRAAAALQPIASDGGTTSEGADEKPMPEVR